MPHYYSTISKEKKQTLRQKQILSMIIDILQFRKTYLFIITISINYNL